MDLAELAYRAYGDAVNWRTFDDRVMPAWSALGKAVQGGWMHAAQAVRDQVRAPHPLGITDEAS